MARSSSKITRKLSPNYTTHSVTDGALRPVNGTQHGASTDSMGALYPAVNNGSYSGHSRILSLGFSVRFDALFGVRRENVAP